MSESNQLVKVRDDLKGSILALDKQELENFLIKLAELKIYFIAENRQETLKEIWCLEKIIAIQKLYLLAFSQLKLTKYYEAWCSFENIEIALNQLFRHFDTEDEFFPLISFIEQHSLQYQSLFPYSAFVSPEFTVKSKVCSVCNKVSSIRNPCGHKNGEIYDGEMCYQIWSGIDYVLFAIVKSPVQKFCVTFLSDPETEEKVDHYDYNLLEYLIACLESPFHSWSINWTTIRYPHSNYTHLKPGNDCPCESGKKYSHCCFPGSGVLRPHCLFDLSVPPPKDIEVVRYPSTTPEKKVKTTVPAKIYMSIAKISEDLIQTVQGDFVRIKLQI
jgi:SEC-C motif